MNIRTSIDKKLLESLCSTHNDSDIFEDNIAESADWEYTRSFLINITQQCNEMLTSCRWNSNVMSCQDLFNAQLTDEGLCCTFNVVHRDKMFRNPKELNPKGVGTKHGLTLVLDANVAEYYCASTESAGFKIVMHNPTETPKIANLGEIFGPGMEARVIIQPRILDAQSDLQYIEINKRLCLTYTLKNCEMECEAKCNARSVWNAYFTTCQKINQHACVAKLMLSAMKIRPSSRKKKRVCEDCMPACTEISFFERITTAPLSRALICSLRLTSFSIVSFSENMLVVHFFFEDDSFIRYNERRDFLDLPNFYQTLGGLLGLCMGFSMMSAVELVYYVTLRVLCMARHRRPKHPFTK
ncbi:hypothetical protein ACJJTC_010005 [Scirpophaga incertulas]